MKKMRWVRAAGLLLVAMAAAVLCSCAGNAGSTPAESVPEQPAASAEEADNGKADAGLADGVMENPVRTLTVKNSTPRAVSMDVDEMLSLDAYLGSGEFPNLRKTNPGGSWGYDKDLGISRVLKDTGVAELCTLGITTDGAGPFYLFGYYEDGNAGNGLVLDYGARQQLLLIQEPYAVNGGIETAQARMVYDEENQLLYIFSSAESDDAGRVEYLYVVSFDDEGLADYYRVDNRELADALSERLTVTAQCAMKTLTATDAAGNVYLQDSYTLPDGTEERPVTYACDSWQIYGVDENGLYMDVVPVPETETGVCGSLSGTKCVRARVMLIKNEYGLAEGFELGEVTGAELA